MELMVHLCYCVVSSIVFAANMMPQPFFQRILKLIVNEVSVMGHIGRLLMKSGALLKTNI